MIQRPHRTARRHRVLIIDDDPSVKLVFAEVLDGERFELRGASDGGQGLDQIEAWQPDLVVLDHRLPDRAGLELLPEITAIDRHLPVLFLTATQSADTAIQAMKLGAFDYATKPVPLDRLSEQVDRGIENRCLLRTPVVMQQTEPNGRCADADHLIGRCPAMQRVYKSLGQLAAHDVPVLIQGEAGTGKKLAARAIHAYGHRSRRVLRTLRCRDHAPDAVAGELFGCDPSGPGGLFAACHGGTLILEEFAELPPAIQSSLLAHLRHQSVEAGCSDTSDRGPDVTLIFTTSGDIAQLLSSRRVRSDLFYELSGSIVALPPLRDREGDIRLLVEYYVQQLLSIRSIGPASTVRVSDAAIEILSSYCWPGNISELKSVLRRALMESRGTVLASEYLRGALADSPQPAADSPVGQNTATSSAQQDDPKNRSRPASSPPPADRSTQLEDSSYWRAYVAAHEDTREGNLYGEAVERLEKGLLSATLEATQGNLAQAARLLGMTRVSLRKKIQKLDLEIPGRVPRD